MQCKHFLQKPKIPFGFVFIARMLYEHYRDNGTGSAAANKTVLENIRGVFVGTGIAEWVETDMGAV